MARLVLLRSAAKRYLAHRIADAQVAECIRYGSVAMASAAATQLAQLLEGDELRAPDPANSAEAARVVRAERRGARTSQSSWLDKLHLESAVRRDLRRMREFLFFTGDSTDVPAGRAVAVGLSDGWRRVVDRDIAAVLSDAAGELQRLARTPDESRLNELAMSVLSSNGPEPNPSALKRRHAAIVTYALIDTAHVSSTADLTSDALYEGLLAEPVWRGLLHFGQRISMERFLKETVVEPAFLSAVGASISKVQPSGIGRTLPALG